MPSRSCFGHKDTTDFQKTSEELFRHGKIDLEPGHAELLSKLSLLTPLSQLGIVRQGIAENPAAINRKVNARFGNRWRTGEGVFALTPAELAGLQLSPSENALIRPYHDLSDLDRYFVASDPSRRLIYATKDTCPHISQFPGLCRHLERFKDVMEQRRETKNGSNHWWHLHWPRDETIWRSRKIIAVQMAPRPSFAAAYEPVYVTFSANVFVAIILIPVRICAI